jgi:4-carboxymuconolactone decarboxylase
MIRTEKKTMSTSETYIDRLPPLQLEQMNEAQRKAAEELIAGPRKGVKGPFIPLLRSPELLARMQKVGEYLRFQSALSPRINEFVTLIVSREWTQEFEWFVHLPLAAKAGTSAETLSALADGQRPSSMSDDETIAYDFTTELIARHGVCDATYARALATFGEQGVMDLVGLIGYFTAIAMVLNVAHTPPEAPTGRPLLRFPR